MPEYLGRVVAAQSAWCKMRFSKRVGQSPKTNDPFVHTEGVILFYGKKTPPIGAEVANRLPPCRGLPLACQHTAVPCTSTGGHGRIFHRKFALGLR
jgi:hypothetical protein